MNKKNNKIFSPVRNQKFLNGVRNDFLSGANGVKNIFRFLPKDYLKFLGRKIMTTVILTVTVMITAGLAIWALAAFTEPVVGPAGSDQDYAQNILGANNADNDFDSSLVTASSTGSIIERQEYVQTQLGTNLDTTVSSRLAAASYVTERGTDSAALASNYTATRAGYLDNLDATVSSRLAAASYTAERGTDSAALASNYTATRAGYLDTLKTGPRGPVIAASAESAATYTHANAAKYCYDLSAVAAVAMDGDVSTTYTDWRLPTVGEAAVFEGTITSANNIWTATIYEATGSNWIILRLSDGEWSSYAYTGDISVRCVR